jgi:hypothetical protein
MKSFCVSVGKNVYFSLVNPFMGSIYKLFVHTKYIPGDDMELKDVQRSRPHERRTYRINIRITESQNKFIEKNNLSITKILNEALRQLGYVQPTIEELQKQKPDPDTKKYSKRPIKLFHRSKRIRR